MGNKFAAEWIRECAVRYFLGDGKIVLECSELGRDNGCERAMDYVRAYGLMTPMQIIQSFTREDKIRKEETYEYLRRVSEWEDMSRHSNLVCKAAD